MRYREDLDLVLKGLSLSIKPKEKIGIVGRTGCGKSTLMSTLFRIVEPTGGRVLIDGHDLAQVPLHQLRSKLALVPQVTCPFPTCVMYSCNSFVTTYSSTCLLTSDSSTDARIFCKAKLAGMIYKSKSACCTLSAGSKYALFHCHVLFTSTEQHCDLTPHLHYLGCLARMLPYCTTCCKHVQ